MIRSGSVVTGLAVAGPASAESINVNFGDAATASPESTYAAAGGAGEWNTITGIAGPTYNLVATDGTTGITMSQSPTTTLLTATDASVSGDDAKLLNHGLVTTDEET